MGNEFKIDPKWSRSKEQIWQEHFAGLQSSPVERVTFRHYSLYRSIALYVAAVIAIIVIPFVYQRETVASAGSHASVLLPDGSEVYLNADSKVTYRPLLWLISREVRLKGEAFFEVEHGKTFSVVCEKGTVKVLGTKFNVYSRENRFDVVCTSGKVEVSLKSGKAESVVVEAGEYVSGAPGKGLRMAELEDNVPKPLWMEGKFSYNAVPLSDVLREIERQYNVSILNRADTSLLYTGSFTSDIRIEDLLEIVTLPYSLTVKKESDREYTIK